MKRVACIVVTYNRKNDLLNNLKALMKQSFNKFDIIIVDNASTDGTKEAIKEYIEIDNVFYYNTGSNLGGAGGFNFGLKISLSKGYKYSWIMDDDTIPEVNSLKALINSADHLNDDFSFLASVVKWKDGTACKMNLPYFSKNWFSDLMEGNNGLIEIDSCSFVSCFINNECAKKVGYPISDFFIYGDDLEYTLRLSDIKQGYIDLSSFVLHNTKDNVADDISRAENNRIGRYFYRFRNLFYITKKYDKFSFKEYRIGIIKAVVKILLYAPGKKINRIIIMLKGYRAGRKFDPKVEFWDKN